MAASALVLVGLIHLSLAGMYGAAAPYIGVMFVIAFAGACAAALGILAGVRGAWLAGAGVAIGTASALLLAATVGLPQFTDSLAAPFALQTLILDALVAGTYLVATATGRSPLGV